MKILIVPKIKFPKSLGEAADMLYCLRERRLEKDKEVKEMKEQETALEEHILNNMLPAANLMGAKGKFGQVSKSESTQASVTDWDELYSYISKRKSWELIQKRVSITSLREIWDSGKEVPGVSAIKVPSLHVSKVGAK